MSQLSHMSLRAGQVFGGELVAAAPYHGRHLAVIKRSERDSDYVVTNYSAESDSFYWSHYDLTHDGAMDRFVDTLSGEYNQ